MRKQLPIALLLCALCLTLLPAAALADAEPIEAELIAETAPEEAPVEEPAEPAADGLIKLDTPTELAWHKVPVVDWRTGELTGYEDRLGELSCRYSGPSQCRLEVEIFRIVDGRDVQANLGDMAIYFPGMSPNYHSTNYADLFFEEGSGTYYFTVKAIGDGVTYADSDTARSDTWTYTAPSGRLDGVKGLTLSEDTISFTLPDEGPFGGYSISYYRADTEDGEFERGSGVSIPIDPAELTPGKTVTEEVDSFFTNMFGSGWYAVSVQLYSGDINVIGNSLESPLSNAVYFDGTAQPPIGPGPGPGDDPFPYDGEGPRIWIAGLPYETDFHSDTYERNAQPTLAVESEEDADALTFEWFVCNKREIAEDIFTWEPAGDSIYVGPSYPVPPLTGETAYACRVTNAEGHASLATFILVVENHFDAEAEANELFAEPGESVTMKVIATSDDPITYRWYQMIWSAEDGCYVEGGRLPGATGPELTVTMGDAYGQYECKASSGGISTYLTFDLYIQNHFTAFAKGTDETFASLHAAAKTPLTLEVDARADKGEIKYQWYHDDPSEDSWDSYKPMPGETSAALTLSGVERSENYYCRVEDAYGSVKEVYFHIDVEDGFTLTAAGNYTKIEEPHAPGVWSDSAVEVFCVYAAPGTEVTLDSAVTSNGGGVTYRWSRYTASEDFRPVEGKTGSSLTVTAEDGEVYYILSATNRFGEELYLFFKVLPGEGPQYDPLDVNHDNKVDPVDAALFLKASDADNAAKALRRFLELG